MINKWIWGLLMLGCVGCFQTPDNKTGGVLPESLLMDFPVLEEMSFTTDCHVIPQRPSLPEYVDTLVRLPDNITLERGQLFPKGRFNLKNQYQALIYEKPNPECGVYQFINIVDTTAMRLTNFKEIIVEKRDGRERQTFFADYDMDGSKDLIIKNINDNQIQYTVKIWDIYEFRELGMVNQKLLEERF